MFNFILFVLYNTFFVNLKNLIFFYFKRQLLFYGFNKCKTVEFKCDAGLFLLFAFEIIRFGTL